MTKIEPEPPEAAKPQRVSWMPADAGPLADGAPLVDVYRADRMAMDALPDGTMTVSGFYDDASWPFPPASLAGPVPVEFLVPDGRWQTFKRRHESTWWLRWLVRLRPVRWRTGAKFTGQLTYDGDGTFTVRSTAEEREGGAP